MDYFFRETTISNPVDSILIVGTNIVFHHHCTIRIYDFAFKLLRSKSFYDKIRSIKKVGEDGIVILFDDRKLVQCNLFFQPYALRIVEGHSIEVYNQNCLTYNRHFANYFNINDKNIKRLEFFAHEIHDVKAAFFMYNYIPTLLVISQCPAYSKCLIVNLDETPTIIDEFSLIDEIVAYKALEKYVVFANRNFIQIKYKRETVVLRLNGNFGSSVLSESLRSMVLDMNLDGKDQTSNIFLENPQIFDANGFLYILNGNGELFKFDLKMDAKKILSVEASFEGHLAMPSSIDFNSSVLVVGSSAENTTLYDLKENIEVIASLFNIGVVKSFTPGNNNNTILSTSKGIYEAKSTIEVPIFQKLKTDIKVNKMQLQDNKVHVYTQDNKCFELSENLDLIEKPLQEPGFETCFEKVKAYLTPRKELLLKTKDIEVLKIKNVSLYSLDKTMLAVVTGDEFSVYSLESFKCIFKTSQILNFDYQIYNEEILTSENVREIKFEDDENNDQELNVNENNKSSDNLSKRIKTESNMDNCQNGLSNQLFISSTEKSNKAIEKLAEILIFEQNGTYILLRTTKQTYIYSFAIPFITKVYIPKPLIFSSSLRSLYVLNGLVYCRSKTPYLLFFNNGISLVPISIRLGFPIFNNGWIYAFFKGNVIKTRLSLDGYHVTGGMIVKELFSLDSLGSLQEPPIGCTVPPILIEIKKNQILEEMKNEKDIKAKQINKKEQNYSDASNQDIVFKKIDVSEIEKMFPQPDSLLEEYRTKPEVKFIISEKDCFLLAVCKMVPFYYIPFVPIVHITDGVDGKTHTEPINKEEAEYVNMNPAIRGRTLRYFIELRSRDFKFISSIVLEPNEFICDMKVLFNDFLFVCTSFPEGEDKMTKGKLTVYSLANIVPDPKNPHITKKLKFIASETFKNSCFFCEEIRSLVAVCIGTRIMIYEFNENSGLDAVGRNEISLLSTSLYRTKNFLAVSDVFNGIFFFFLRPKDPLKLHLLARSNKILDCRYLQGIDFTPVNSEEVHLSLLAVDQNGSIMIYTYSPDNLTIRDSNFLVRRAQIITKAKYPPYISFFNKICNQEANFISNNHSMIVSTIDVPKIQVLQHCIALYVSDTCGLNPRNYLETEDYVNSECKSVVSEKILLEFFSMNPQDQMKVCKLFGQDYNTIAEMIEACYYGQLKKAKN